MAWWVLVVSEAGAGAAAAAMVLAPSGLPEAWGVGADAGAGTAVRAWGVTWLALTAVVLAVLLGERPGARARGGSGGGSRDGSGSSLRGLRVVLVVVPAVWLSHALLAPGTWWNLVLAAVTAAAVGVLVASGARAAAGEPVRRPASR